MIYDSGVKHVARFWLRHPDDTAEIEPRIAQLATIPQVENLVVGRPLPSDWGKRIDKSWDIAFVCTFRDLAASRAYFDDALHQRVAAELQDIADRVEAFYIEY